MRFGSKRIPIEHAVALALPLAVLPLSFTIGGIVVSTSLLILVALVLGFLPSAPPETNRWVRGFMRPTLAAIALSALWILFASRQAESRPVHAGAMLTLLFGAVAGNRLRTSDPAMRHRSAKVMVVLACVFCGLALVEQVIRQPIFALSQYLGTDAWLQDLETRQSIGHASQMIFSGPNQAAAVQLLLYLIASRWLSTVAGARLAKRLTIATGVAIVATGSRMVALIFLLLVVLNRRESSDRKVGAGKRMAALVGAIVGALLLAGFGISGLSSRISVGSVRDAILGRSANDEIGLDMIGDRPVLGHGFGSFFELARDQGYDPTLGTPHNVFVLLAFSYGLFSIVGLCALLTLRAADLIDMVRRKVPGVAGHTTAFVAILVMLATYPVAAEAPIVALLGFFVANSFATSTSTRIRTEADVATEVRSTR